MRTFLTASGKHRLSSSSSASASASASASVASGASRTTLPSTIEEGEEELDNCSLGDSSIADESTTGNSAVKSGMSLLDGGAHVPVDAFLKADRDNVISKLMEKERVITILYGTIFPLHQTEDSCSSGAILGKGVSHPSHQLLGLSSSKAGASGHHNGGLGNLSTLQSLSSSNLFDLSSENIDRGRGVVDGGITSSSSVGMTGGVGRGCQGSSRGSDSDGDIFCAGPLLKPIDYSNSASGETVQAMCLSLLRPGTTGLLQCSLGNAGGNDGSVKTSSTKTRATTSGQS